MAENPAFGKRPAPVRASSAPSEASPECRWTPPPFAVIEHVDLLSEEMIMTWGKGALLWLLGIPLPIIILLALFWR